MTTSLASAKKIPSSAAQEMIRRERTRRKLVMFAGDFIPNYQPGWVHEDICARLERFSLAVLEKKSPRLLLLVPPRHGKSALASVCFPAWHLGRNPTHEIINVGYSLDLPMKFSRQVRDIVREPRYHALYPEMRLNVDSQSVEEWLTTKGGGFKAAGVGGGITGRGAHILIIDDPIRNQEDADSIDLREKLDEWYQSTAATRLSPGGGVLFIECMTGDTPVMLPDGTEQRLDTLKAGDEIATYENGRLSTSRVAAQRSSGRDNVLKITTSSGKIVRANGRHPFLAAINGELKWVRTRGLTTAHKIVVLSGSGGSGKGSLVQQIAASTTATIPGKFEDCSATTATPQLDILELSAQHLPLPDTSDFTLDKIVSIETDGEEEVFDIQVDRTTNFVANSTVCSNTWWHDDDLAGRFQRRMVHDELADQYEIVKYPAISEKFEYRNRETFVVTRSDLPDDDPELELLREPDEALHPERYPLDELKKMRANKAPRIWSALYQQNPVPEEGVFFRKEYLRLMPEGEYPRGTRFYCGWDFAIGQKKQNDFTVGAVIAHIPNDTLWLADLTRFKGDAHMIMSQIIDMSVRWMDRPDCSFEIGFEDGQIWKAIEPSWRVETALRSVFPPYRLLKPLTDKLARANPLQGRMQHGRFFIVEGKSWTNDVIHEFLRFPAGEHDDIVDAVAWAARMAVDQPSAVEGKHLAEVKSWREKLNSLGRDTGSGSHMGA